MAYPEEEPDRGESETGEKHQGDPDERRGKPGIRTLGARALANPPWRGQALGASVGWWHGGVQNRDGENG
jgi:hypothetical protein